MCNVVLVLHHIHELDEMDGCRPEYGENREILLEIGAVICLSGVMYKDDVILLGQWREGLHWYVVTVRKDLNIWAGKSVLGRVCVVSYK